MWAKIELKAPLDFHQIPKIIYFSYPLLVISPCDILKPHISFPTVLAGSSPLADYLPELKSLLKPQPSRTRVSISQTLALSQICLHLAILQHTLHTSTYLNKRTEITVYQGSAMFIFSHFPLSVILMSNTDFLSKTVPLNNKLTLYKSLSVNYKADPVKLLAHA